MANETRSLQITSKLQDQASSGFAKLLTAGRGAAGGLVSAFKGVGVAIGAIAAASGTAFVAFRRVATDLDNVAKAVDRLGVSAESLTAIRNGAKLAGIEFDELTNSVKFFEKFVTEASSGGQKQRQVLAELGLQAEQFTGQNLDLVDILGKVGDGLNGLGGSAKQTEVLLQLFGRTGSNLAPLLKQGSTGIQKLAAEARSMSAVFSREELARVEEFEDAWDRIKQTLTALADRIVIELSPAFTELFETLRKTFAANTVDIREAFLGLISIFLEGFKVLSYVFDTVKLSIEGWKLLALSVQQVTAAIQGNSDASKALDEDIGRQIDFISRIKEGYGETAEVMSGLEETIARLRAQASGGPIVPPVQTPKVGSSGEGQNDPVPPDAWKRFNEGARQASLAWRDFTATAYQSGQQLVGGTLNAFNDAIAAGITRTKSWGQAWKDLGRATLGILAQVITKLITVKVLSYLFPVATGGGGGGGATPAVQANGGVEPGVIHSTLPLQRFAMGGIARGPTLALMGEGRAPAEAFVPLPDGKTIPVSFRGDGGGGQVVNVVQNFHSTDARSTYELFKSQRGTIRGFVTDDMKRRNGFRGALKGATR